VIAGANVQQFERLIAKRPLQKGKFGAAPAEKITD
jgi:hypothetical protein